MILMHGCAGWHGSNVKDWADFFADNGIYAVSIDSFGPRGVDRICRATSLVPSGGRAPVTALDRAFDAFATLDALAANPMIDPKRIGIMGFSHGGSAAMAATNSGAPGFFDREGKPMFAAAVLMYPGCYQSHDRRDYVSPVMVVEGTKDDWTGGCRLALAERDDADGKVDILAIEGATHAFDQFSWKGQPVQARYALGKYWLQPDRRATQLARREVMEFLRPRLGLVAQ
jgi:dienelactone hydrolase